MNIVSAWQALCRACQLISLIASTSSEAVSTLVRHPFLDSMSNCLQQSTQILAEHGTGGSGWDSPSTAFDDETFPGNNAIQAAFNALEVTSQCGFSGACFSMPL